MSYRFYLYWEIKFFFRQFRRGFWSGRRLTSGLIDALISDIIYLVYWILMPIGVSIFRVLGFQKGVLEGLLIGILIHGLLSGITKSNFEVFENKGRLEAVLCLPHSLNRLLRGWILGGLALTYIEAFLISLVYLILASFVVKITIYEIPLILLFILVIPGLSFLTSVGLKVGEDFLVGKTWLRYSLSWLRLGLGLGLIWVGLRMKVDLINYLGLGIFFLSSVIIIFTNHFITQLDKETAISKWAE